MRLIDAGRLKKVIADNVYLVQDAFNSRDYGMFWTGGIEKAIDETPTVDPVRYGHWVNHISENGATDGIFCSQCDYEIDRDARYNYCPNCGARMDGKDD